MVVAKQHFSPLAAPISSEICFIFIVLANSAKVAGTDETEPEVGTDGWAQGLSVVSVVAIADDGPTGGVVFRYGALPMIPPSRNLIAGDLVENISAIDLAVRGEIALRSKK